MTARHISGRVASVERSVSVALSQKPLCSGSHSQISTLKHSVRITKPMPLAVFSISEPRLCSFVAAIWSKEAQGDGGRRILYPSRHYRTHRAGGVVFGQIREPLACFGRKSTIQFDRPCPRTHNTPRWATSRQRACRFGLRWGNVRIMSYPPVSLTRFNHVIFYSRRSASIYLVEIP